jgi:transposase-like protein
MCSSKKGISAHQLMRNLELGSYRTAWFMAHRIRWAMGQEPMASRLAGIVEIDDTWVGGKLRLGAGRNKDGTSKRAGKDPNANKIAVVSALQRDGEVRSIAFDRVTGENARPVIEEYVERGSHIMTDSSTRMMFGKYGWQHSTVDHSKKEYSRHEDGLTITTNTVEGYFSIIKRGIHGVYHHVGKHYLDQYLREFDYRYNVRKMNDGDRTVLAIKKTHGKRLMLKEPKKHKM